MADEQPVPITLTNVYTPEPIVPAGGDAPPPQPETEPPLPIQQTPGAGPEVLPEEEEAVPAPLTEEMAQQTEGVTSPVTPGQPEPIVPPETPLDVDQAILEEPAPEEAALDFMLAGAGDKGIQALIKTLIKAAQKKAAKGPQPSLGLGELAKAETAMTMEEVKQILSEGSIEAQRRGFRPRDPIHAQAEELAKGLNPDVVREIPAGTVMDDLASATLIHFQKQAHARGKTLAEQALVGLQGGDYGPFEEFLKQLQLQSLTEVKKVGVIAEAGRSLGILNDPSATINMQAKMLKSLLTQAPGKVTPTELLHMYLSLDDPVKTAKFARAIGQGVTRLDMLQEYWINSILSAPSTHAANVADNAIRATTAPMEALLYGVLPGTGTRLGESAALMKGWLQGVGDWTEVFFNTMKAGQDAFTREMTLDPMQVSRTLAQQARGQTWAQQSRMNRGGMTGKVDLPQKGFTAANVGIDPDSPMGRIADFGAEAIVRMPTRALMAEDTAFKMLYYRMGVGQYAYRKAIEQAEAEGLKGTALTKRRKELEHLFTTTPTDYADVHAWARDYAFEKTLQKELGRAGQAFLHFREEYPAFVFVLPFVRTPVNIAKMTLQYTPVEFLATAPGLRAVMTEQAAILRDGAAAGASLTQRMSREQVLSRAAFGSFAMSGLVALASVGILTPSDKDYRRVQFRQEHNVALPNSIRLGGEDIQFSRLGVFGQVAGLAGDLEQLRRNSHSATELAAYEEAVAVAVSAISKNITNPAFMQGIFNLSRAAAEPDKFGAANLNRFVSSFVPNFMNQTNAAIADTTVREARGVVQQVCKKTWGCSKTLPPRIRLIGGDEVDTGMAIYDAISPAKHLTVKPRPGVQALEDNAAYPEYPDEWFVGTKTAGGVEMTAQQRHDYVKLMNSIPFPSSGKTLADHLDWMVTDPLHKQVYEREQPGPRGGRARMLLGSIREAEARVKDHMLNPRNTKYADLQEAYKKYNEAREALLKPAAP